MTDQPTPITPTAFGDLSYAEQLQELSTITTTGTPYRGNIFQLKRIQRELETSEQTIPGYTTAESLAIIDKLYPTVGSPTPGNYHTPTPYKKPHSKWWYINIGFWGMSAVFQIIAWVTGQPF